MPVQQEPRQVFISYSSTDSEKAKEFVHRLEGAGVSCWISQRDIPPGADFALEIQKALINCKYYVILLTNAAQDSPYVMLELDQAFKQKKEIIPVALEDVVQNEKTNFYLNAKQCVDGIKSLTAAVNKVLCKIKPEYIGMPADTEETYRQTDTTRRKTVCCPKCSCTVLKQRRLFVDKYLYPLGGRRNTGDKAMWIMRNRRNITDYIGCIAILSLLLLIVLMCCNACDISETGRGSFRLAVNFLMACGCGIVIWLYGAMNAIPDVIKDLEDAISESGLKYWTFKCANCEHEFSVLLPKEDQLKDWVPDLLEVNAKKDQSTDK